MEVKRNWFPSSRRTRYTLITRTSSFMGVPANRTSIGFDSSTPNGVWYDTDYSPVLDVYNSTYRIWDDPATSSVVARDNLTDAEKEFFPMYREFYRIVKGSPLVTNGNLEEMGFPPRPDNSRTRHPVDKQFVDLNVKPLGNLVLNVMFIDRDSGKSIVPYYLNGVVIYYAVSDTPIVNQKELTTSRLASRSPMELIFEPELRGKSVYLAGRW
ncbi:MAG: hypothetical protein LBH60_07080, partial [Prevotellaceae bacterium]|nr:hypothetical protein [Prevotellaceae bacterium]